MLRLALYSCRIWCHNLCCETASRCLLYDAEHRLFLGGLLWGLVLREPAIARASLLVQCTAGVS
jgi:hypothetical protein